MSDNDEWIDITNEVILETNLECEDGKILVPKWPGSTNLKVLRRKEKEDPGSLVKVGDAVSYRATFFEGQPSRQVVRRGRGAILSCEQGSLIVCAKDGKHYSMAGPDIRAIYRDGLCIYNAATTSTDTPASSENSD